MKDKIKEYKNKGFELKQELEQLIKPFISSWLYIADLNLKDEYGNSIRGIAVGGDSLFFQNDSGYEYSLLSFSLNDLYNVYLYVSE